MNRNGWVCGMLLIALASGGLGAVLIPQMANGAPEKSPRQAIFEAEDLRAPDEASLKVLADGVKNPSAGIRRAAVRALGRLERPEWGRFITPLLEDADAMVRAEAANALGQSVHALRAGGPGGGNALNPAAEEASAACESRLSARLRDERDPFVRGIVARTIGRLPYKDEAGIRRAEKALLSVIGTVADPHASTDWPALHGAAKGAESLLRLNSKTTAGGAELIAALKILATRPPKEGGDAKASETAAQVRRLAVMALTAAKRLDEGILKAAADDPDDQVRRLAMAGLGAVPSGSLPAPAHDRLLDDGLRDASGQVRYEALRRYGRTRLASGIDPVLSAVRDRSPHVALLAVDLLGQTGPGAEKAVALLQDAAGGFPGDGPAQAAAIAKMWPAAAHALVSLARIAPESARALLPKFASAAEWPVRMYAARSAGVLKDVGALERLAGDPHDNVREAALSELIRISSHAADELLIAALERPDYQLLLTAAGGLKGSPSPEKAVPALLAALARLTGQRRDTSRDPRLEIVERIGDLGSAEQASALSAYAGDFDPRVAEAAAAIVARWTGRKPEVPPKPLPVSVARIEDLEPLRNATVRITMAGKGAFELRLLLDEAPATVARFVSLVRAGYYNGLTFHRVAPNFLIQGGSPGANEYMGDGPYLRDEVGLESHLRGAVGISTRGRDTGDAQICPDVVDNVRLDHDYTVFARVTSGMEIVDIILECDVIERIEVIGLSGK